MSQEGFSQKEIDALLNKQSQETDSPRSIKEKVVFAYNFKRQRKIDKNQSLVLQNLHKRFLRNIEASFTSLLNMPIIATLASANEIVYEGFSESLSQPTCLYSLDLSSNAGQFLLEVDPKVAFFIIDKVLGGKGIGSQSLSRELSLIEERILYRIITLLLKDLEQAWTLVTDLKIEIGGFFSQSDYVQLVDNKEKVYLISVEIRGEKVIGFINICMPATVLGNFLPKDKGKVSTTDLNHPNEQFSSEKKLLYLYMKNVSLQLQVILGKAKLEVGELVDMEIGDIIQLDSKVNGPLGFEIGNTKIGNATLIENKYVSLRVKELL